MKTLKKSINYQKSNNQLIEISFIDAAPEIGIESSELKRYILELAGSGMITGVMIDEYVFQVSEIKN